MWHTNYLERNNVNQIKSNILPNRGKISPKILIGVFFLLLILIVIGFFLRQSLSKGGGFDITSDKPTKIAADSTSLEPYCIDGYYKIPTESAVCSRAPNCGGYGYDELNTQDKMPNPQTCMGDGDSQRQEKGCAGYVPLCCYEMARTGDYTKCIGYWERLWCTKSQCDVAASNGASGSQCGGNCGDCGHAFRTYCGENKTEIPLITRLGSGNSQVTPTPTTQASSNQVGKIRIATFNILVGENTFCDTRNNIGNVRAGAVSDYFVTSNIDAVFLQEAGCIAKLAQYWQDALRSSGRNDRVYYSKVQYLWAFDKQMAILSRHSIDAPPVRPQDVQNQNIPLEVDAPTHKYLENDEHRRVQSAVVVFNDTKLRLANIHPSPNGCGQIENDVKGYLESFQDYPIIMGGDYNCSAGSLKAGAVPWLTQNFDITCTGENSNNDPRCGKSTKDEGEVVEWQSGSPIDHISVLKSALSGTQAKLTSNYKIVRNESLAFSDHLLVEAEAEILSTQTPQQTPTSTPRSTVSQTPPTPTLTPSMTHSPTPSPNRTPTNTLTPTLTPTLTYTPTITPTRTPSPPSTAMCDRTCGVCGWRDTAGVCHTDGTLPSSSSSSSSPTISPTRCCYAACIGSVCKQVSGYGRDSCTAIGQSCTTSVNNYQNPTNISPSASPVIVYVTATPKLVGQNVTSPANMTSTTIIPITQSQTGQSPPVSGGMGWLMLLVIPVVIIGAAVLW